MTAERVVVPYYWLYRLVCCLRLRREGVQMGLSDEVRPTMSARVLQ